MKEDELLGILSDFDEKNHIQYNNVRDDNACKSIYPSIHE